MADNSPACSFRLWNNFEVMTNLENKVNNQRIEINKLTQARDAALKSRDATRQTLELELDRISDLGEKIKILENKIRDNENEIIKLTQARDAALESRDATRETLELELDRISNLENKIQDNENASLDKPRSEQSKNTEPLNQINSKLIEEALAGRRYKYEVELINNTNKHTTIQKFNSTIQTFIRWFFIWAIICNIFNHLSSF